MIRRRQTCLCVMLAICATGPAVASDIQSALATCVASADIPTLEANMAPMGWTFATLGDLPGYGQAKADWRFAGTSTFEEPLDKASLPRWHQDAAQAAMLTLIRLDFEDPAQRQDLGFSLLVDGTHDRWLEVFVNIDPHLACTLLTTRPSDAVALNALRGNTMAETDLVTVSEITALPDVFFAEVKPDGFTEVTGLVPKLVAVGFRK